MVDDTGAARERVRAKIREAAQALQRAEGPVQMMVTVTLDDAMAVMDELDRLRQPKPRKTRPARQGELLDGQNAKGGYRIPADFRLTDDLRHYAASREFDPDALFERFRDHWLASDSPHAWKHNWSAAWRTWVNLEVERRNGPNGGGRPGGAQPARARSNGGDFTGNLLGIADRSR